ncbi:cell wall-binding repeat-containing protein [Clostridium paridis]|uniref:Cell wall-binding repeat-containing protein n=1 Tax=Clostridium paridis TaxID=2803863 RepID=A0A937FF89_9CLOT|nr:cell wall-binding repeat-containing protein [Clostridium paridis]MBL4932269.1 cell wall-binding repeat-containing protein [Clostridium paridis]
MGKGKIAKIFLGSMIISSIIISSSQIKVQAQTLNSKRLQGKDRYETATAISYEVIKNSTVNNVVLATGSDFPDALTGSVLAAKLNAPILLTGNDSYNAMDLDFIRKNLSKTGTIYILGSSGVIPDKLISQIKANGYNNVIRLGGKNREETARIINQKLSVPKGTPVVIATGLDFPDALSISSVAGIKQYPIALSYKDSLPAPSISTLKDIQPSKIYIVGSAGVVSDKVVNQIKATLPSISSSNIVRIGGKDRFETSVGIAKAFNLNTTNAVIATGFDFPDALSGSVLASKLNAPILLVNDKDITATKQYLASNTKIINLTFLGSYGAIGQDAERNLTNITIPPKVYQPDVPERPSVSYMNSISKTADASIIDGGMINERKLPYDGNYYHIQTTDRLPNGSLYIQDYYFKVLKEETQVDGKVRRYVYMLISTNGAACFGEGYYLMMN